MLHPHSFSQQHSKGLGNMSLCLLDRTCNQTQLPHGFTFVFVSLLSDFWWFVRCNNCHMASVSAITKPGLLQESGTSRTFAKVLFILQPWEYHVMASSLVPPWLAHSRAYFISSSPFLTYSSRLLTSFQLIAHEGFPRCSFQQPY